LDEEELERFMPARSQSLQDAMNELAQARQRKAHSATKIAEQRLHVMEKEIERARLLVRAHWWLADAQCA